MKIIDCFSFFNELDLLEIRLNTLNDIVDRFIICESLQTHSGVNKPLFFELNKERFKPFLSKITHVITSCESNNSWLNEFNQRNDLDKGFLNLNDEDIILLSDVDEIPNPETIKNLKVEDYFIYNYIQKMYYYYLNYQNKHLWQGTQSFTYKTFKESGNKLTEIRRNNNKGFISNPCKFSKKLIDNGGWHFSYMGGVDSVIYKMKSFMHQELLPYSSLNKNFIYSKIENGDWIWNDGQNIKVEKVDMNDHPKYILDNLDKFKHLIKV